MIFYRSLLAALNKRTREQQESGQEENISTGFDTANYDLKPESISLLQHLGLRFSIYLGLQSDFSSLLTMILPRRHFTSFNDVRSKEGLPSRDNPVPLAKRPLTKLERICLSSTQLAASLKTYEVELVPQLERPERKLALISPAK
jgi:hypothetical protein